MSCVLVCVLGIGNINIIDNFKTCSGLGIINWCSPTCSPAGSQWSPAGGLVPSRSVLLADGGSCGSKQTAGVQGYDALPCDAALYIVEAGGGGPGR